jgi:membrane-bound lytic murein transglycosylase B
MRPFFCRAAAGLLAGCFLFQTVFAAGISPAADAVKDAPAKTGAAARAAPASWQPLLERLKQDGLAGPDLEAWFAALEPYSQRPMGLKARSLFRNKFMPAPFAFLQKPGRPGAQAAPVYLSVMSMGNIRKSAEFLRDHQALFELAEREYQVEKEIIVALFMTETRLGEYIGTERALWNLASMAASTSPEQLGDYLGNLPLNTPERREWARKTVRARSDWAYRELVALIDYCRKNGHDPLSITGSPFGAIGLCQFMPTNIPAYAVDGNKDGRIDLFNLDDAVCSIANFAKKHGWKNSLGKEGRRKVIYRYNHSYAYADTVLAMAEGVKAMRRTLPLAAAPVPAQDKSAE